MRQCHLVGEFEKKKRDRKNKNHPNKENDATFQNYILAKLKYYEFCENGSMVAANVFR